MSFITDDSERNPDYFDSSGNWNDDENGGHDSGYGGGNRSGHEPLPKKDEDLKSDRGSVDDDEAEEEHDTEDEEMEDSFPPIDLKDILDLDDSLSVDLPVWNESVFTPGGMGGYPTLHDRITHLQSVANTASTVAEDDRISESQMSETKSVYVALEDTQIRRPEHRALELRPAHTQQTKTHLHTRCTVPDIKCIQLATISSSSSLSSPATDFIPPSPTVLASDSSMLLDQPPPSIPSSPNTSKRHIKPKTPRNTFDCALCLASQRFIVHKRQEMVDHLVKIHCRPKTTKPYPCPYVDCPSSNPFSAENPNKLKRHLDGVHKHGAYKCEVTWCSRVYGRKDNRLRHVQNLNDHEHQSYLASLKSFTSSKSCS
jgi:hypothetical protein